MTVLQRFYGAFAARDASTMGACYAEDARFSDPVFGDLKATEVRAMWKMLLGRSADLRIRFNILEEDERRGVCEWQAHYTFTSTGRKVHNLIRSEFELRDGSILVQRDHFDLWRWSRQALGPTGLLLGWSSMVHKKVQGSARAALDRAMN